MSIIDIRSAGRDRRLVAALDRSLALIEFDLDGKVLTANATFCAVLGYPLEEIKGRHHSLFVDPEEAGSPEYAAFWAKLRRGEFDAREYRRIGKGDREVWIQASYNPVTNGAGKVVKIVKVATDITGDKLRALDAQARMQAVSRVQAVIEFDTEGTILTANENFLAALGYQLDEIAGRHHSLFVEPDVAKSDDYRAFWRRLNAGEFVAAEFKRIGKGGREVWIQASYNPVFDLKGRVSKVVKFATDITGRVRAVQEIGDGLSQLAANDLTHTLDETFEPAFEKLRSDFNTAVRGLRQTMIAIGHSTSSVSASATQIAQASDDLSRRTEQQAASLEETAAALDEITATVKRSAEGAKQANQAASAARDDAARSGEVMREGMSAMGQIEESSKQIGQIIGVIDEIAFQTNLLALNAGVEAARAGEAGRGFAVVAQEVRALAQRSAEAAKEIRVLISSSSGYVDHGVKLVSETSAALSVIVGRVAEIDRLIAEIARSAQEQATGLGEVNVAVNQMDQFTQQNAAMVEEATAAASSLKGEAGSLDDQVARFRTGEASTPKPTIARHRVSPRPRLAVAGGRAGANDGWEEF